MLAAHATGAPYATRAAPRTVPARPFLGEPERGGNAVLGVAVHVDGTDEDLDGVPVGPDDRGVQGTVEVVLRRGDEVLEPAGDRAPSAVYGAEHRVTVVLRAGHADRDAVQFVRPLIALRYRVLPAREQVARHGHG